MKVFSRKYSGKCPFSIKIFLEEKTFSPWDCHSSDNYSGGRDWKSFTRVQISNKCGTSAKSSSTIIPDTKLVRHLGIPLYQAFYHLSVNEGSEVKRSDFDPKILRQRINPGELQEAINRIHSCLNFAELEIFYQDCHKKDNQSANKTGVFLQIWRETKAALAGAIVVINRFDWYQYQITSSRISREASNIGEYLLGSLNFISQKSRFESHTYQFESNQGINRSKNVDSHQGCYQGCQPTKLINCDKWSLLANDLLQVLEKQVCYYPPNLKIRICLGVDLISKNRDDRSCFNEWLTDDRSWWEWFLIVLVFIIIFAVLLWITLKLFEYPPDRLYPTDGIRV